MSITEKLMSLTVEQKRTIVDEAMEEVRAELDTTKTHGIYIYDDSDEAEKEMNRRIICGSSLTVTERFQVFWTLDSFISKYVNGTPVLVYKPQSFLCGFIHLKKHLKNFLIKRYLIIFVPQFNCIVRT